MKENYYENEIKLSPNSSCAAMTFQLECNREWDIEESFQCRSGRLRLCVSDLHSTQFPPLLLNE